MKLKKKSNNFSILLQLFTLYLMQIIQIEAKRLGIKCDLKIVDGEQKKLCHVMPQCAFTCASNEKCVATNRCDCKTGYGRASNFSACEPICEPECDRNAICVGPNECQCNKNYEMINNSCMAICQPACEEHAYCTVPQMCQCKMGYYRSSELSNCRPVCSKGCPNNANCTAPELCSCPTGYLMSNNECMEKLESKKCLKEFNILMLLKIHVSCDQSPILIYLIYGTLCSVILIVILISWKGYERWKRSLYTHSEDYVVEYNTNDSAYEIDERFVANTSSKHQLDQSPPPAYDTLNTKVRL